MTSSPRDDALAGLVGELAGSAEQALDRMESERPLPAQALPGAAAAVAAIDDADGTDIACAGSLSLVDAAGRPLELEQRQAADEGTLFDLASVTKTVTALTALRLIDAGALDPEAPVAEHLDAPHAAITPRHLLTHTSGLPPVMPLWRVPGGRRGRMAAVRSAPLVTAPGEAHAYSCIGYILLGQVIEQVTGRTLPRVARDLVLDPAGMGTASWDQVPPESAAATELQEDPPRGLVRARTHDETAWSIGGAGNAGLFSAVRDVIALGRVLAGRERTPLLSAQARRLLSTDQLPAGISTGASWRQAFGPRIGHDLGDGAAAPQLIGHPGFTGTSVLADPRTGRVAVLLTTRVHPRREQFSVERARQRMARLLVS